MQQKIEGSVGVIISGNADIQNQHNGDVYVLNAAGIVAGASDENSSVRAWREFVDHTQIPASAPACRFLRLLLSTEDITPREINRVWGKELRFYPSVGLQIAVPRLPYVPLAVIAVLGLVSSGMFGLLFIILNHSLAATAALMFCSFCSGGFFWLSADLLTPYRISRKLVPMVLRVNAGLGLQGNDE